ncbi:MAG: zinc ABC transporter substrate-binding protein [Ignisphaera sp.]
MVMSIIRSRVILGVILLVLLACLPKTAFLAQGTNNLGIVVTFPLMIKDIEAILCEGDEVSSIVPLGVDPHEYQLTFRDAEILAKANIVVSTAHTPFEARIKELILSGEINTKLIEIPNIPGILILKNPSTNVSNYHGILFHGYNYIIFLKYLRDILSTFKPECANVYYHRVENLINRIESIEHSKPLKGFKAVIDTPVIQYLVTWLGANVTYILAVEHDVPVVPQDIDKVEEILKLYKQEAIVVITEDSSALNLLSELAFKYSVKILVIPNPIMTTQSILTYLENITKECQNLLTLKPNEGKTLSFNLEITVLIFVIVVSVLVAVLFIQRVRK